jgi:putative ABC transport system permease protein
VIGGSLGLAGAWWLGVQLEPVFRQYLPGFALPADAVAVGIACMVGLGLVAGAVPAGQAMRLRIVEALRRE